MTARSCPCDRELQALALTRLLAAAESDTLRVDVALLEWLWRIIILLNTRYASRRFIGYRPI